MEELLSKEEILARSQQENKNGDEMEKTVRIQGESFSLLFVFLIGIVLLVWKRVHHLPDEDVLAMFWVSCVANRLYRLTRRKSTSDVVLLLISLAFLGYNLVKFFQITG